MGLGALFHRNVEITQRDTETNETIVSTFVTGNGGGYADWQDQGASYQGGMGIPGAWRAAILLSDLLGAAPWHAYSDGPLGVAERVTPTPPLLAKPAPPDERVTTFSSAALDLIWHGNAIGLRVDIDGNGSADAMLPVPARSVFVTRVQPGSQIDLPIGDVAYHVGGRWFSSDEVIHVKGPCEPGELRGMGVLECHLASLDMSVELRRQARAASGEGIPTGVLTSTSPDTTIDQLKLSKAAWMDAQRTRTVAALGPLTDFKALAWNPTDAQLLESRKFTLHELGLIFGVPLSFLGVEGGSRTYTNVEQEGLNLIKFSLSGHLSRFEQALSAALPAGQWAKANLDAVLRADTLARYQAHEIALRAEFLTVDEVRAIEDRSPLGLRDDPAKAARNVAEMVQKLYLGVGRVLSVEDARSILRAAGAELGAAAPALLQQAEAVVLKGTGEPGAEGARSEVDLWMYWTTGKGRTKWTAAAEPLTALYKQLRKYLPEQRAAAAALAWFEDGMGRKPTRDDGEVPDLPEGEK